MDIDTVKRGLRQVMADNVDTGIRGLSEAAMVALEALEAYQAVAAAAASPIGKTEAP